MIQSFFYFLLLSPKPKKLYERLLLPTLESPPRQCDFAQSIKKRSMRGGMKQTKKKGIDKTQETTQKEMRFAECCQQMWCTPTCAGYLNSTRAPDEVQ